MVKRIAVDDMICVFMKNIRGKPDGVYVVGQVTRIDRPAREFSWRLDLARSARTLVAPVSTETIKRFFPRSYGHSVQPLDAKKRSKWIGLLGRGEVLEGVPAVKAKGHPRMIDLPAVDPEVSAAHGRLGEQHVIKILRKRYQHIRGSNVVHVAAKDPGADHDLEVRVGRRVVQFVEVKTRVGKSGDPVQISERQMRCRRVYRGRHTIFIVYLGPKATVRDVREIDSSGRFALKPHKHWLFPGTP
jgi:hypothetical protein